MKFQYVVISMHENDNGSEAHQCIGVFDNIQSAYGVILYNTLASQGTWKISHKTSKQIDEDLENMDGFPLYEDVYVKSRENPDDYDTFRIFYYEIEKFGNQTKIC